MSGIDYAEVLAIVNGRPDPAGALRDFVEQEREAAAAEARYRTATGMDEPVEQRAGRARENRAALRSERLRNDGLTNEEGRAFLASFQAGVGAKRHPRA